MAINRETLEYLRQAYLEEVQKIREKEEKQSEDDFAKKKFVNSPTLQADTSREKSRLAKEQERRIEEQAKALETRMFQDYGGSYAAGLKHFVPASEMNAEQTSQSFSKTSEPTPEQMKEIKRQAFFKKTLQEFNDKSQEKGHEQDHDHDRE